MRSDEGGTWYHQHAVCLTLKAVLSECPSAVVADASMSKLVAETIYNGIHHTKPPVIEASVQAAGKLLLAIDNTVQTDEFIKLVKGLVYCAKPESSDQPDIRRMAVVSLKNVAKLKFDV